MRSIATNCGPLSYTLSGGDPTIMSLNPVSGSIGLYELKLEATLASQVNQYAYTILIGLQNYPSATKTPI